MQVPTAKSHDQRVRGLVLLLTVLMLQLLNKPNWENITRQHRS